MNNTGLQEWVKWCRGRLGNRHPQTEVGESGVPQCDVGDSYSH